MTTPAATPRLTHRPADQRGLTDLGWLHSRHSFSFGTYHHPERTGYHCLRVLNDDRVAPAMGFDTHPHRNMEILTWVLGGELAHQDSMGHQSTLGAGGVQLMSAGTGVTHSETNASPTEPVHFLQVWINPRQANTPPRYQEAIPDPAARAGRFIPLATPDGRGGSLVLGADAEVHVGDFAPGQSAPLALPPGRVAYLHVARGAVSINGHPALAGDAVTAEGLNEITVDDPQEPSQVLAFVLPD